MSIETNKIQPSIASFFGAPPKAVTEIECIRHGGEKNQCSYSGGWFTPQGFRTHESSHMRTEHSKNTIRTHRGGGVKVTEPIYANSDKTTDAQYKNLSDDER